MDSVAHVSLQLQASVDLSSLLARFLEQCAYANAPPFQQLVVEKASSDFHLCKELETAGHVECCSETDCESNWRLTGCGMRSLTPMYEVCRPSPVFPSIQDLESKRLEEIKECSSWELLRLLQHRGWHMCKLPSARNARRRLPAHTRASEALKWYCGSASISLESPATKAYMAALVVSDELFTGLVSRIHHGERETYYQQLLDPTSGSTGELPEMPLPVEDQAAGLQLMDESDLCIDHNLAAHAAESLPPLPPVAPVPRHRQAAAEVDDDGSDISNEPDDIQVVHDDSSSAAAVTDDEIPWGENFAWLFDEEPEEAPPAKDTPAFAFAALANIPESVCKLKRIQTIPMKFSGNFRKSVWSRKLCLRCHISEAMVPAEASGFRASW